MGIVFDVVRCPVCGDEHEVYCNHDGENGRNEETETDHDGGEA